MPDFGSGDRGSTPRRATILKEVRTVKLADLAMAILKGLVLGEWIVMILVLAGVIGA